MTTKEYIQYQLSQGVSEQEIMQMVKKRLGWKRAEKEMLEAKNPFKNLFNL